MPDERERRWLVFAARLRPGARERARALIEHGPPFALDETPFDAHEVFLSNTAIVFVFERRGERRPLHLSGDDPAVLRALSAWDELLDEAPLPAETVFSWQRP